MRLTDFKHAGAILLPSGDTVLICTFHSTCSERYCSQETCWTLVCFKPSVTQTYTSNGEHLLGNLFLSKSCLSNRRRLQSPCFIELIFWAVEGVEDKQIIKNDPQIMSNMKKIKQKGKMPGWSGTPSEPGGSERACVRWLSLEQSLRCQEWKLVVPRS